MHNIVIGKLRSIAQISILENAKLLAEHFKIDPAQVDALKVQEKDPVVKALKEQEAVATLIESITVSLGLSAPVADVPVETGEGLPEPVVESFVPTKKRK